MSIIGKWKSLVNQNGVKAGAYDENLVNTEIADKGAFPNITLDIEQPGQIHVCAVLLLDTSVSMDGTGIVNLNSALNSFLNWHKNRSDSGNIDIAVVTFNSNAQIVNGFTPLSRLEIPNLTTSGSTNLYAGLNTAYALIKEKRRQYANLMVSSYVPWIILITDGMPDTQQPCIDFVKEKEGRGKFYLYGFGTTGYDKEFMNKLCAPGALYEFDKSNFEGAFQFISDSLSKLSDSKPDEETAFPDHKEYNLNRMRK